MGLTPHRVSNFALSPCEHSTVNNHTNIQTPPLRLRIQIMIKELSLDRSQAVRGVLTATPYLGISLLVISDKGKSSASTRTSLHWKINVADISILLEQRL